MKYSYSNILIIGHKNIGDIFHNIAILKPLRLAFPDARISFLTSAIGKVLLDQNRYLSEIFILTERFKDRFKLIFHLRQKKIDLVINLKKGSWLGRFLGAPVWSIPSFHRSIPRSVKRGTHIIDIYLDILRERGISVKSDGIDMKIVTPVSEKRRVEEILRQHGYSSFKKLVVIAPFSNWHAKEWSLKNFAVLSQRLAAEGRFQTIFVGGENDRDKMKKVEGYRKSYIDLVGKISLRELAALYEKAILAIGGDSGPFHLATSMGVPALGIFAPTPHQRYGPYFTRDLTVSCEQDLGCNPCVPAGKMLACGVYHRTTPCMELISVERVYRRVTDFLKKRM